MVGNSLGRISRSKTKNIMNSKLYVGNLSFDATENDLHDLFAPHGTVTEANLMQDRMTGKPRGFAFVTMATKGRALTVNEARPREERSGGGGGGGGYRGGGGGGGGRRDRY